MSYEYTACRTIGHAWDVLATAQRWGGPAMPGGDVLKLRCTRCAMEREDVIDGGTLLARHYKRPSAYHYRRTTRTEWRAQFINNLTRKDRNAQRRT